MPPRNTTQLQNRPTNVGGGGGSSSGSSLGDADAGNVAKWAVIGMVFFGAVCFAGLPIAALILMDAKKTNANAHAALAETKKLQAQLKPKKEQDDE